ncbi:MAG: efflux RND transporter periplasmic adaptor subunit [Kiritimatiellia bacterium]
MKKKIVIGIAVGLLAGLVLGRSCGREQTAAAGESPAIQEQVWTCSMHPQIRQPAPGQCPICGMDLIPAGDGKEDDDSGPTTLALSDTARALAELEVSPVERRPVEVEVRMTGKVQLDETLLAQITARVPGRIDRLYANVTGTPVKQGEHLADLYSPELLSAQQELMQAAQAGPGAEVLLQGAREKLRLWGLTAEQIENIEKSKKMQDHLTFFSPIGGIVVEKEAVEGMYVEPGTRLFTVADLSSVWVKLDAYESDLAWISYGQPVEIQVEAFPGEIFSGTVSFIDPLLDAMTRTVKVRVNVANPDLRLKPEMFVHALLKARVSADGRAIPPDLQGKWMCPMHPEVMQEKPGSCRICGMDLEPAEGKESADENAAPLVIPASAPLITGTRAVVYVAIPGNAGSFEGREISLGPRAGNVYVVMSGLEEGETVVTRGNFKIDSSLQIQGKTSMLQPAEAAPEAVEPAADPKVQTMCPVMGGKISKEHYADYNGMRIYFCCPSCKEPFLKDPETYLQKMREAGVEPEMLK